MDAKAKKALVDTLSDAKNFDTLYPTDSRRWFVDMAIRAFEAQSMSDVQIETKTIDLIVKATRIVMAKRDFSIGLKVGSSLDKIQRKRRVEILYGAIASHPEFGETANADLLEWDARRRLRGVTRMDFFVNPNSQGYFRYPKTCPTNERWRLNVDAQAFWEESPAPPAYQYPFPLKRPTTGDPNYVTAIGKVWTAKKKPCEGNLLDCGVTAGAVMLDSVLEAKDQPKLLKKVDSRGATNLAIHHISRADDDSFIGDPGAEGLFERGSVAVGDLQVGDHVYIFNHGLYKEFRPTGSWTGEHSLVFNAGDRNYRSKNGFHFGGHGKEGTVFAFYDDFLAELQTYLHRAFRIGAIFLAWKNSGGTTVPAAQVQTVHESVPWKGNQIAIDLHEFKVGYSYPDYQKAPKKGEGKPKIRETGFVVAYAPAIKRFLILKARTLLDIDPPKWHLEAITFERKDGTPEFDPLGWAILYVDPTKPEPPAGQDPVPERYEVFTKDRTGLTPKKLTIDDLFKSPFAKRDPKKEPIAMTRPRVSFTSAYKTFLSANGAI